MKKFVPVLLSGLLVSFPLSTAAKQDLVSLNVEVGLNLNLNGQDVQPVDASGQRVPVFLYDSTTYVPVRFISEFYGFDVEWDMDNGTVLLKGEPDIKEEGSGSTATRNVYRTTITAEPGIKLSLNGELVQPKDASGKDIEVYLYGSTTYVPVRFISEYYGMNVLWDPDTATVSVSDNGQINANQDVFEMTQIGAQLIIPDGYVLSSINPPGNGVIYQTQRWEKPVIINGQETKLVINTMEYRKEWIQYGEYVTWEEKSRDWFYPKSEYEELVKDSDWQFIGDEEQFLVVLSVIRESSQSVYVQDLLNRDARYMFSVGCPALGTPEIAETIKNEVSQLVEGFSYIE